MVLAVFGEPNFARLIGGSRRWERIRCGLGCEVEEAVGAEIRNGVFDGFVDLGFGAFGEEVG